MNPQAVIAIPVLNEEAVLERTITILIEASSSIENWDIRIIIADNGSSDDTPRIGRELAEKFENVRYLNVGERGKGRAIRHAWRNADADVYAFMDADLATDLSALRPLLDAASAGGVAYGSRFHEKSVVDRSLSRRLFSHGYRMTVRTLLSSRVTDAPCGFKAVSRRVVRDVMPTVQDQRWFFDTELLIRAERSGVAMVEVPVIWKEHEVVGRRSKVDVPKLALEYMRLLLQLRRDLL